MKAIIDSECVLHILPKNNTEAMALKYWISEFAKHGPRLLEVETVEAGRELFKKEHPHKDSAKMLVPIHG